MSKKIIRALLIILLLYLGISLDDNLIGEIFPKETDEIVSTDISTDTQADTFTPASTSTSTPTSTSVSKPTPTSTLADIQKEELPSGFYLVTKVVDGDTIAVDVDGEIVTIRLIGIDTPETVHSSKPVQCFGIEASEKAKDVLFGMPVRLEFDKSQGDQDRYGRTLAYVFLEDGTNFNEYMLSNGYAYEYTYSEEYKYQADFKSAQELAKNNSRGLWTDGVCDDF